MGPILCCFRLTSSLIIPKQHCTHINDVVINQYYPNLFLTIKIIKKNRFLHSNTTTIVSIFQKRRRVAATIVGLVFLDTALYRNQYQRGCKPEGARVGPNAYRIIYYDMHVYCINYRYRRLSKKDYLSFLLRGFK